MYALFKDAATAAYLNRNSCYQSNIVLHDEEKQKVNKIYGLILLHFQLCLILFLLTFTIKIWICFSLWIKTHISSGCSITSLTLFLCSSVSPQCDDVLSPVSTQPLWHFLLMQGSGTGGSSERASCSAKRQHTHTYTPREESCSNIRLTGHYMEQMQWYFLCYKL